MSGRPEFHPLSTCPPDKRARYAKVAVRATSGSLAAAARLKCLECCGWYPGLVRQCQIRGCRLWLQRALRVKPMKASTGRPASTPERHPARNAKP